MIEIQTGEDLCTQILKRHKIKLIFCITGAGNLAIVDGSSMGLGVGSGNAQLEKIVVKYGWTHLDGAKLREYLQVSRLVENAFEDYLPRTNSSSVESSRAGVFSGYAPHVKLISFEMGIEQEELWNEIGRHRLVAG